MNFRRPTVCRSTSSPNGNRRQGRSSSLIPAATLLSVSSQPHSRDDNSEGKQGHVFLTHVYGAQNV